MFPNFSFQLDIFWHDSYHKEDVGGEKGMSAFVQGLQITVLGIGIVLLALWGLSLVVDLMSRFLEKGSNIEAGAESEEIAVVTAAISAVIPPERIRAIDIKRI
jgi:Na+-transporting methylmalonyl-CoA/oxaloacetate decarboxylase gamma subunit